MMDSNQKRIDNLLQKFHSGEFATSTFYISIISGIPLLLFFDISQPLKTLSLILVSDYLLTFLRNLHYWSSQYFLIFSFLHLIDHISRKSESKIKSRVWLHITLSIPVLFYLILSGFILKGDSESLLAFKILKSLLQNIPYTGEQLSYLLMGNETNFQIIYFHHIATASILLLFFILEHSRLFFPKSSISLISLVIVLITGFLFTPLPADEFSVMIKGPWYFIGLQEILHYLKTPNFLNFFILFCLIVFYLIKFVSDRFRKIIVLFFSVMLVSYSILSLVGMFFRGSNWELTTPSLKNLNLNFELNKFINQGEEVYLKSDEIKFINNRAEGCLNCHIIEGIGIYHNPDSIGCFSCHRGNPYSLNRKAAHMNLIKIPGNLSNAKFTCGNSNCHPDVVYRVNNSIMTTMSGVVSTDKIVFDELKNPDSLFRITEIKHSVAESHLRSLCASCHLSNDKNEYGRIDQLSRGGGCLACHLNHSKEALSELDKYLSNQKRAGELPGFHPSIDLKITNEHCFGCHSRSGRISTNYMGWSEILSDELDSTKKHVQILDGRFFEIKNADVHYDAGMDCIDCHNSFELMGDGSLYSHKDEQIKIRCEDCHSDQIKFLRYNELDYETQKVLKLRNYVLHDSVFITLGNSRLAYSNPVEIKNDKIFFTTKISSRKLELRRLSKECKLPAHKNLSCQSCHTSWVTYCVNCHTYYDKNKEGYDLLENKPTSGSWNEEAGDFHTDYPALGVVKQKDGREKITTFIPGMILKTSSEKKSQFKFKRIYAPAFSHTITRKSRSCESCHQNPLALGFGKGAFEYKKKERNVKIFFKPHYPLNPVDMLPVDAWIGYNKNSLEFFSVRKNISPLSPVTQKKILTVGVCLLCHTGSSNVMQKALIDFNSTLKKISPRCLLPEF